MTQDVLLFNFDTMHSLRDIESDEAREFYQATQPEGITNRDNVDINRMKTISDRLLGAISNLKLKYKRYEDETGVKGISAEELTNRYPNGLEAPFY